MCMVLLTVWYHCLQSSLQAAVKYRRSVTQLYRYSTESVARLVPEFIPWTASVAVRDIIRKQVRTVCCGGV